MEGEREVYQVLNYCKLCIESVYVLGLPENMHCRMIHAIDVVCIGRKTGSNGRGYILFRRYQYIVLLYNISYTILREFD